MSNNKELPEDIREKIEKYFTELDLNAQSFGQYEDIKKLAEIEKYIEKQSATIAELQAENEALKKLICDDKFSSFKF